MTDQITIMNTSGMGKDAEIPDEIKGWSWGGFCLNWFWAIFNNTWIGLLVFIPHIPFIGSYIPFIDIIMLFVLGFKGREWAWRNKKWQSIEHFKSVQRKWSIASLLFYLFILLFVALMIYFDVGFVTR